MMTGVYGRTKHELQRGLHKMRGYITRIESAQLDRLMDILRFFQLWQEQLRASPPTGQNWERYFITRESWFDLRLSILGFVAMSRYLLANPDNYTGDRASPNQWRGVSSTPATSVR